jgi:mannose-6-phosphate isomerase-like protein (cupin superfamily)
VLIPWDQIPVGAGMRPGSTRQAVSAEQMSAVRVVTTPDAVFSGQVHRHANEQMLVVVEGSVDLVVDDDRFTANVGDFVFFPPGSWHGAVGVGPVGAVYYELFAPPRLDQLPGWIGPSALELK